MLSVVWVESDQIGTALAMLWGGVVVAGLVGIALQSNSASPGAAGLGRFLTGLAVFLLLPAITPSCSTALQ
jgi:hypothetical protein